MKTLSSGNEWQLSPMWWLNGLEFSTNVQRWGPQHKILIRNIFLKVGCNSYHFTCSSCWYGRRGSWARLFLGLELTRTLYYNMEQLALQQPVFCSFLFFLSPCWWGSGRESRGIKCITVVRPNGKARAPSVTLPCRNLPWYISLRTSARVTFSASHSSGQCSYTCLAISLALSLGLNKNSLVFPLTSISLRLILSGGIFELRALLIAGYGWFWWHGADVIVGGWLTSGIVALPTGPLLCPAEGRFGDGFGLMMDGDDAADEADDPCSIIACWKFWCWCEWFGLLFEIE